MAKHVLEFDVRPTELDSFGHVNNARYMEYCEWARADWSMKHGLSYQRFIELGVIPAVVDARLRFLGEARLGDRLRIETSTTVAHSAKVVFHHEIRRSDGRRVFRADVQVVAVDYETRTITEYPAAVREAFEG